MFSASLDQLTEDTSIALAQAIQFKDIPLTPKATVSTAYVQQGQGDSPILLLHGFDSSVMEFRRLFPLLAENNATWAIDLLGFGFTDRLPDLTYSPATIKDHLYQTWKTLINQPVILVGASMGGAAAIDFTLTYPEAVQKLVLLDSAGFSGGPAVGKFLFSPLDRWAAGVLQSPKVRKDVALKAYHDPVFASEDAYRCGALHLTQPGWQAALAAFTRSGGYTSFRKRLGEIQQPTLIVWGRSDRILGTADAARFQQAIPDSQLVWVPECGHVPHLEKAAETAVAIQRLIAESSIVTYD